MVKIIFIINKNFSSIIVEEKILETNSNAKIFEAKYVPMNIKEFDLNEKYLVFSGIGNHKTFLSMLKNNKMIINKDIEFPDHYNYSEKDLENILKISKDNNLKILTTEKDFFRLNIKLNEIKFIKSKLEISNKKDLINILSKLYE